MANGMFLLALITGAALLALWIHVRFPSLAPERFGRTMLHVAAAVVLMHVTRPFGESLVVFAFVFFVVLPTLTYALLSALWMIRLAQSALGLSR